MASRATELRTAPRLALPANFSARGALERGYVVDRSDSEPRGNSHVVSPLRSGLPERGRTAPRSARSYRRAGFSTLIEHWNGTKWLNVKSPNPRTEPLTSNILHGITCTNVWNCTAVGNTETGGLVERWNGKIWSVGKFRSPASSARLNEDAARRPRTARPSESMEAVR